MKFSQKNFENWRFWKMHFFWVGHFDFFFSKKKIFFGFFPMKISQSLLVSKDGSKFWSSQMWQHFLTHTKHSRGECTNIPKKLEGTFLNGKLCRFLQFLYLYFVLKRWQNFISKYLFLRLDSECIYFMNSLATRNQQFGCQIDAKQW